MHFEKMKMKEELGLCLEKIKKEEGGLPMENRALCEREIEFFIPILQRLTTQSM